MKTIMVTGSRDLNDEAHKAYVWNVLTEEAMAAQWRVILIHGASPKGGADTYADQWGTAHQGMGVHVRQFPPEIDKYGYTESMHRRNQAMVDFGPDIVHAFIYGKSLGTRSTVRRAKAAGLSVREHLL